MRRCGSGISCMRMRLSDKRVSALDFGKDSVILGPDDAVILAVPPYAAAALLPGLADAERVPRHRQRAFPHRPARASAADPGRAERDHRMDLRLPGPHLDHHQRRRPADRHAARRASPRPSGARSRPSPGCPPTLPPWQIVRERRATFAATPEQDARRPGPRTRLDATWCWPAIGQIPACPPRSKVPFDPATAPPRPSPNAKHLEPTASDDRESRSRPGRAHSARNPCAARPPEAGWTLGLRARGRQHHPGRIRPDAALSRRAGRRRAGAQDRASICAACRARTAAGRCSTKAPST